MITGAIGICARFVEVGPLGVEDGDRQAQPTSDREVAVDQIRARAFARRRGGLQITTGWKPASHGRNTAT